MQTYIQRQWEFIERPFRPDGLPHTETIFTIGNGLIGTRGTFEEGYPNNTPTTFMAGIFNHPEGELVPELIALPNWLDFNIKIDGESFQLSSGKILGYERTLNMKNAVLSRGVLWQSSSGKVIRFAFERFASLANPHLATLRVLIQPLPPNANIVISRALDGSQADETNINHWAVLTGYAEENTISIHGKASQSGYEVAMSASLTLSKAGLEVKTSNATANTPKHLTEFQLNKNEKIEVTKIVAFHSTRDTDTPLQKARETLDSALSMGYEAIKQAHEASWEAYWDNFDILIEGDEVAQRGVRFCTYHLLIATSTQDERVSIGAKTLSGYGYKGHVFWDTELFMLPPMTFAQPELAKRLLMYRYHNLTGARNKAREAGYKGAMFPWESTDTGEETTPRWVGKDKDIRIYTGDNEQHISSDIAYAILQFWHWTGDDAWFTAYGAEIVLDTSVFWGSRVEHNEEKDRYELKMQIGPDEYHENIDNSVFTNRIVVWHLRQSLSLLAWLKVNHVSDYDRLVTTLGIDESTTALWKTITEKMFIPRIQHETGEIFEQFEGFFEKLQPLNLEDYTPKTTNIDAILGHHDIQSIRAIKQADVVMLMALLGNELGNKDFLKRNWDVYSVLCDHGSSLSPAVHSWVASQLGLPELAYELFVYASTIDLEDHKGNVHDGIHAANCGGVWQAVVLGFCGLHIANGEVKVSPNLPAHWRRVKFNVYYKGKRQIFDIQK